MAGEEKTAAPTFCAVNTLPRSGYARDEIPQETIDLPHLHYPETDGTESIVSKKKPRKCLSAPVGAKHVWLSVFFWVVFQLIIVCLRDDPFNFFGSDGNRSQQHFNVPFPPLEWIDLGLSGVPATCNDIADEKWWHTPYATVLLPQPNGPKFNICFWFNGTLRTVVGECAQGKAFTVHTQACTAV